MAGPDDDDLTDEELDAILRRANEDVLRALAEHIDTEDGLRRILEYRPRHRLDPGE